MIFLGTKKLNIKIKMKLKVLIFKDRFGIQLKKRLSGVVEQ